MSPVIQDLAIEIGSDKTWKDNIQRFQRVAMQNSGTKTNLQFLFSLQKNNIPTLCVVFHIRKGYVCPMHSE